MAVLKEASCFAHARGISLNYCPSGIKLVSESCTFLFVLDHCNPLLRPAGGAGHLLEIKESTFFSSLLSAACC